MLISQTTAAEGGKFQGAKNVVLVHGAWGMGRRIELVENHPVARS
jgi:hypothetical protein